MIIRPNCKLVNTDTQEILTYGNDNTTVFGGPWGELQKDQKAVWQSNAPTLDERKEERMREFSDLSFTMRNLLIPDYKLMNASLGVYTEQIKGSYLRTVEAFRVEFYRLSGLVIAAVSVEEVDAIQQNYPTQLVP
jgi:hypothetical protein